MKVSSNFFFNFFFYVYFWQRERDRAWVGEGQRERETQNQKQAPGSEPSAQSLTQGSNSRTTRSWPEPKSDTQPTEPPRCPWSAVILIQIYSSLLFNSFTTMRMTFQYMFLSNEIMTYLKCLKSSKISSVWGIIITASQWLGLYHCYKNRNVSELLFLIETSLSVCSVHWKRVSRLTWDLK